MDIFIFGSCRIQIPLLNADPIYNQKKELISLRCHYLSEIIQLIKYIQGDIEIPKELNRSVFREPTKIVKNRSKIKDEFNKSEQVFIEISSVKNMFHDYYFNILQATKSKLEDIKITMDTYEDIVEKIIFCNKLLNGKPTVYIPHLNVKTEIGYIEQRQLLQNAVREGASKTNQKFFDLMSIIDSVGYHRSFKIMDNGKMDFNHIKSPVIKLITYEFKRKFLSKKNT